MLKIIAAVAENGVIGNAGGIPWRLPDDMKWFKERTGSSPVVMGRKTFESLPPRFRPLPGRENIVFTRDPSRFDGVPVTVATDFSKIVERAQGEEVWVIGGAELYELALPCAIEMLLTQVHMEVKGDVIFPEWDESNWRIQSEEFHQADERHLYSFTWQVYRRRDE